MHLFASSNIWMRISAEKVRKRFFLFLFLLCLYALCFNDQSPLLLLYICVAYESVYVMCVCNLCVSMYNVHTRYTVSMSLALYFVSFCRSYGNSSSSCTVNFGHMAFWHHTNTCRRTIRFINEVAAYNCCMFCLCWHDLTLIFEKVNLAGKRKKQ